MRLTSFWPLYEGWARNLCDWPIEESGLERVKYELTRRSLGEAFRFRFSTALEASYEYFTVDFVAFF